MRRFWQLCLYKCRCSNDSPPPKQNPTLDAAIAQAERDNDGGIQSFYCGSVSNLPKPVAMRSDKGATASAVEESYAYVDRIFCEVTRDEPAAASTDSTTSTPRSGS